MTDKSEGFVVPVSASVARMKDIPSTIKELPFSPLPKPKRRSEDCKA